MTGQTVGPAWVSLRWAVKKSLAETSSSQIQTLLTVVLMSHTSVCLWMCSFNRKYILRDLTCFLLLLYDVFIIIMIIIISSRGSSSDSDSSSSCNILLLSLLVVVGVEVAAVVVVVVVVELVLWLLLFVVVVNIVYIAISTSCKVLYQTRNQFISRINNYNELLMN